MPQSHLLPPNRIDFAHWTLVGGRVVLKALGRLWGRDVMLYTGGVSFFALLAAFPALAITLGVYSLLLTPDQATAQAAAFAQILPASTQSIFEGELQRLAHAPMHVVSTQSLLALIIALYASHRGIKALIAGLSFIHEEDKPKGFFDFNFMALLILMAALLMLSAMSGVFLAVRLMASTLQFQPLKGVHWFFSEWTWASIGLSVGLTLIYRYAMSTKPVEWRASIAGGVAAAIVSLAASWGSAIYVRSATHFGAMYGSIAAVVVMLVWLSWTVNALFFGAALATEIEIATTPHTPARKPARKSPVRRRKAKSS